MRQMQFSIKINVPKEVVWNTIWDDKSFRDWGNIIDEGQYRVGEIKEGNEVQFISAEGMGITSLVEKFIPNEYVLFRQLADTIDSGMQEREKQWTGGMESFELLEDNGITDLTVKIDVPNELEEIFGDRFPRALERIKILAEEKE